MRILQVYPDGSRSTFAGWGAHGRCFDRGGGLLSEGRRDRRRFIPRACGRLACRRLCGAAGRRHRGRLRSVFRKQGVYSTIARKADHHHKRVRRQRLCRKRRAHGLQRQFLLRRRHDLCAYHAVGGGHLPVHLRQQPCAHARRGHHLGEKREQPVPLGYGRLTQYLQRRDIEPHHCERHMAARARRYGGVRQQGLPRSPDGLGRHLHRAGHARGQRLARRRHRGGDSRRHIPTGHFRLHAFHGGGALLRQGVAVHRRRRFLWQNCTRSVDQRQLQRQF